MLLLPQYPILSSTCQSFERVTPISSWFAILERLVYYRLISQLERLVYNRLISHINDTKLLYEYQFGFQKGKSTHLAIVMLVDKITEALDQGESVVGVFLYARLKNGRIMLWQCPSVCPSVRPSVRVFRTFFQRALRYQFETWYIHSVGGTTCRVWVSSQLGHFDLVYSQK